MRDVRRNLLVTHQAGTRPDEHETDPASWTSETGGTIGRSKTLGLSPPLADEIVVSGLGEGRQQVGMHVGVLLEKGQFGRGESGNVPRRTREYFETVGNESVGRAELLGGPAAAQRLPVCRARP